MNTSTSTENLQNDPAMDAAVAGIDLTAPQTPQSASILLPSVLGQIELLTEAEAAELQACEAVSRSARFAINLCRGAFYAFGSY